ncbi:M48 family metallopeptidase [Streptomyces sp. PsTaAH-124]|uniref:M48 family metallopeptidase n=1 Tax=Streptomyces sp. PsTaAH-124 TaxID=1157638 RepID=UPI00038054C6|nr:M48 family metallopeptidase [Streptomyces sp. PsTaAH-124]
MSTAVGGTTRPCPECGARVPVDERFTVWCAACDWNVDPGERQEHRQKQETEKRRGKRPGQGRLEEARRALARRHGERLHTEMTRDGADLRARRDGASVLAYALALAVHGVTAALLAGGVLCLVWGWGGGLMLLGAVLLVMAVALRPRLSSPLGDGTVLRRADAPELYALVDEVARAVGTRGVDTISVGKEINASVISRGLRGRRALDLGLPLWEVLTPQQRVALLGHELGHYANGDTRHGRVVGSALRSLATWRYYFLPTPRPSLGEMIVNAVYAVPLLLVQGTLSLLDHLTLRATQRAEYLADREAARTASTEAAAGLMDQMLVLDSIDVFLRRESNNAALAGARSARRNAAGARDGGDLWTRLAAHLASVPEHEYERQRRVGARRGHSVDSTHPPTHLRRAFLLTGPPAEPAVVLDEARQRRIAAELATARAEVARSIVRDGVA